MRCPGSVIEIDTHEEDGQVYFQRFFCAFRPCIEGFQQGCRPYLSIDSTALNGRWNGHMASANALNGHNWLYPVAFGFFCGESTENWTWFMEQLGRSIGYGPNLAICTDACKGLAAAVKTVFPSCEHRECFRHLVENFKKGFQSSLGAEIWPAARTYRPGQHERLMARVFTTAPGVKTWLDLHHKHLWARSKFSTEIKCDYINNNLAESWNSWVKEFKDLPLDALADAIRHKTMKIFAKRRKISQMLHGDILPIVIHQLNAASHGLGHLSVSKGGDESSEVIEYHDGEEILRHVVYPERQQCTCREWQISGKPCRHALAMITTQRLPKMDNYVSPYFSVWKFRKAYEGVIPSITDRSQWPEVNKGFKLQPPSYEKRGVGRQRKNRFPSCLEKGKSKIGIKRQVTCSKCGEKGHRQASYKCPLNGTKKRKRTRKNKVPAGRKKSGEIEILHTPKRPKSTITTQPSTSPGPVTRRMLAMALESGECSSSQAALAYGEGPSSQAVIEYGEGNT